jgi:hypothetical protein
LSFIALNILEPKQKEKNNLSEFQNLRKSLRKQELYLSGRSKNLKKENIFNLE